MSLTKERIKNHYDSKDGERGYEGITILSDHISHAMRLETCEELLQLDPDEHTHLTVVDLGAGTGAIGKLWAEKHPNSKRMLCVDPSSLLDLNDTRIDAVSQDAESFVSSPNIKYDALLCIQAFHNIVHDHEYNLHSGVYSLRAIDILSKIYAQLNDGGRICIATRPTHSRHLPFWEKSHSQYGNIQLERVIDSVAYAGFKKTAVHRRWLHHEIPKYEWYELIRNRFFSHLSAFTDEEIEYGIAEMEAGSLKDVNLIPIDDVFYFVVGWKTNSD